MALQSQPELNLGSFEDQIKGALTSWMNMQRPFFSMMTEINGRFLDQAMRMNAAWFNFVGRQIEHEIDATRRLMGCRNVKDIMVTYQNVMEDVQRDTQTDLGELARANKEAADATLETMRAGLREAAYELQH